MTQSKSDSSPEMPMSEIKTEELEINLEDIEPPIPPDGGWGWVVLVGSFICMFFVDGLSFSFGIILPDVQESFQCSTTTISLAGSFIVGFTLISGDEPDRQCYIERLEFSNACLGRISGILRFSFGCILRL
ncbi:hypothetical protein ACTXT7_012484 [Hymenolepis weldensis]